MELTDKLYAVMPQLGVPETSLSADLFRPTMDPWLVKDYYGILLDKGEGADVDIMAGSIREEYNNFPHQVPGGIEGYEHEFALCAVLTWAERHAEQSATKPFYHYYFDHDLPGENGAPRHGSEMQYTFGNLDKDARPWTEYDFEIEDTVVDYWTGFAKTGNPNAEDRPEWKAFTKEIPVSMHVTNDGIKLDDLTKAKKTVEVAEFIKSRPGVLRIPFKK